MIPLYQICAVTFAPTVSDLSFINVHLVLLTIKIKLMTSILLLFKKHVVAVIPNAGFRWENNFILMGE